MTSFPEQFDLFCASKKIKIQQRDRLECGHFPTTVRRLKRGALWSKLHFVYYCCLFPEFRTTSNRDRLFSVTGGKGSV